METILRRSYATLPSKAKTAAAAARTASTPLAVCIRRLRRRNAPKVKTIPGSDSLASGMTPSDFTKYSRKKYEGLLPKNATEARWMELLNRRRQRVRGFRRVSGTVEVVGKDGTMQRKKVKLVDVIGEKIYLPNVIIRLVPNPTKPGEPYNPFEATFRIPMSFTKTDLRSYLRAVYGVEVTYIRTDNYIADLVRGQDRKFHRKNSLHRTFKRATVGLVDPFYYPDMTEDMSAADRTSYVENLDQLYHVTEARESQQKTMFQMFRKNSDDWKWDGPVTVKKSAILRRVAEARAERERKVEKAKKAMLAARSTAGSRSEAQA